MLKKKSLGAAKTAAALFLSLPVLLPALSSRAPAADWILPAGAGAAATPPASVPKAAEPARTGGNAPSFKKVMIIIFENTSYQEAASQPFFSSFAGQGALLTDFDAETHPSQGNYIALVSGDYQGVTTDKPVNLGGRQIGDLLEARGLTWKVYAQGYPGGCFLGARSGNYVRKHVPFLSFTEVQSNPGECANITDDSGLKDDIASGCSYNHPQEQSDCGTQDSSAVPRFSFLPQPALRKGSSSRHLKMKKTQEHQEQDAPSDHAPIPGTGALVHKSQSPDSHHDRNKDAAFSRRDRQNLTNSSADYSTMS